ncbi:hypothetical protein VSU19_13815, partial [Verrucomicrobiales bacterium BCK34]|nr:hypothetical protein [Verrucomicrobiales bacterium BCK34]
NTIWRGDGNSYHYKTLRVVHKTYTPQTFPEFQKVIGDEATSTWEPVQKVQDGIGADEKRLHKLKVNR